MDRVDDWPATPALETARLLLEPLRVDHAEEMVPLLGDAALYEFTGGGPATPEELRARYRRQALGRSPDGSQLWLNWIVRLRDGLNPLGTVQATVTPEGGAVGAELAWVIAAPHQKHGYAIESAEAITAWLREHGASVIVAHIHPRHHASIKLARALGLRPTAEVRDGEIRWIG